MNAGNPPPVQHEIKEQQCKSQLLFYTTLALLEGIYTVVLAKYTLSLYSLWHHKEFNHWIKLTHFSHRREVFLRPLEVEMQRF